MHWPRLRAMPRWSHLGSANRCACGSWDRKEKWSAHSARASREVEPRGAALEEAAVPWHRTWQPPELQPPRRPRGPTRHNLGETERGSWMTYRIPPAHPTAACQAPGRGILASRCNRDVEESETLRTAGHMQGRRRHTEDTPNDHFHSSASRRACCSRAQGRSPPALAHTTHAHIHSAPPHTRDSPISQISCSRSSPSSLSRLTREARLLSRASLGWSGPVLTRQSRWPPG